jgi:hypothetical protein
MRQQKSKLICKCGTKGGVLTFRRAGNSKKKNSLYIQHYDPTKKSGKRTCYISKKNITLIELNDKRYHRQYKPLTQKYTEMLNDDSAKSINEMDHLLGLPATLLLEDMRWPDRVVPLEDKFFADVVEFRMQDFIRRYQDEVGIKLTRERAYKMGFRKTRFKMTQDEKEWWKEVAKSRGKILQGSLK